MPVAPGPELKKVTVNLYAEDVATLKAHYPEAWSTVVRDLVGDHAHFIRRSVPRTLEELDDQAR